MLHQAFGLSPEAIDRLATERPDLYAARLTAAYNHLQRQQTGCPWKG